MNQSPFNDYTFNQALARARAADAAELTAILAGNGPPPSRDISDMLRQQAQDHLYKVLSGAQPLSAVNAAETNAQQRTTIKR